MDDDGSVVDTWVIREIVEVQNVIHQVYEKYPEEQPGVIIESPPQWGGNNRPYTQEVEEMLRRIFPDATWANPGQWKGTPASRIDSSLKHLTQHEKDAVGLGRYFKSIRRRSAQQSSA